jgi:DNA-binding NarL/FixJ family response regulator
MSINVAIIESDELVFSRLARLLEETEGLRCCGQYASGQQALNAFPHLLPDVVLMDIHLPNSNGVEWVCRIRAACPGQLILVLSNCTEPKVVFSALAAGATGYLLKHSSSEQIIAAIQEVYQGGSPMTGSIARQVVNLFQQAAVPEPGRRELSRREKQVLELLAKGFSYKEIAEELKLTYATIHTHIRHIYKKFRVNCRTEAVTLYLRQSSIWPIQARPAKMVEWFNETELPGHFAPAVAS